jgi:hypothetical protein
MIGEKDFSTGGHIVSADDRENQDFDPGSLLKDLF